MLTTSLIQRGKFKSRPEKVGIDNILLFDYMGSSEFEWGALPKALADMRKNITEYTYMDVPMNGKVITVFCNNKHKPDIKIYLQSLAENKWYLQEYSDFNYYIYPTEHCKSYTDFWWDIQNHIMFWRKDNEFEKKFKVLIEIKN